MTIQVANFVANATSGGSFTTYAAPSMTVTPGDVIHVFGTCNGGASAFTLPSDGQGNTYTQIGTTSGTRGAQWYGIVGSSGSLVVSLNWSSSQSFPGIWVKRITGAAASPFIVGVWDEFTTTTTGANNVTSGNANVTSQPALLSSFCQDDSINTYCTAGTSPIAFTLDFSSSANSFDGTVGESARVTSTGNQAATYASGAGSGQLFHVAMAAFLEATPDVLLGQVWL